MHSSFTLSEIKSGGKFQTRHHRSRYAGRGCFGLIFDVSILTIGWESSRGSIAADSIHGGKPGSSAEDRTAPVGGGPPRRRGPVTSWEILGSRGGYPLMEWGACSQIGNGREYAAGLPIGGYGTVRESAAPLLEGETRKGVPPGRPGLQPAIGPAGRGVISDSDTTRNKGSHLGAIRHPGRVWLSPCSRFPSEA